jgi:hypothetical protein
MGGGTRGVRAPADRWGGSRGARGSGDCRLVLDEAALVFDAREHASAGYPHSRTRHTMAVGAAAANDGNA